MAPSNSGNEPELILSLATKDEKNYLDEQIDKFNGQFIPFAQKDDTIYLDYTLKDKTNTVVGGITSIIYCKKCLYIDVLWIQENYRYMKYGIKLLKLVESEANKIGCTLAHLNTFDFQAKDFYLKNGYEIFGTLEDCPPGHKRFFLKKNL